MSNLLITGFMTRNANSSYNVRWRVIIFATMIVYGVYMATNYDINKNGLLAHYMNSTNIFDGACSYLAQWLLIM